LYPICCSSPSVTLFLSVRESEGSDVESRGSAAKGKEEEELEMIGGIKMGREEWSERKVEGERKRRVKRRESRGGEEEEGE
jgi:hypothetical protein